MNRELPGYRILCEICEGDLVRMRAHLTADFKLACGPCYLATATPQLIADTLDAIEIETAAAEKRTPGTYPARPA